MKIPTKSFDSNNMINIVRKGFRARKGETTCKPETDKFILKMRRHWITSGTVF
jgi:hypothetical protein